ncbi:MAG: hypothetical protein ABIX01_13940 [Chitinophagaceae bacterium]
MNMITWSLGFILRAPGCILNNSKIPLALCGNSYPAKQSLQLTVDNGRTNNWDMLEIDKNYLYASVHLMLNEGSDNIETFRLIQDAGQLSTTVSP